MNPDERPIWLRVIDVVVGWPWALFCAALAAIGWLSDESDGGVP